MNSVYSLCLKCFLSYQSTLRKNILLFWSLHFLSAFFHKISPNVSRNMPKIQTESCLHLTMSKWPISTAKLLDKEIFHGFWDFACNLATTWRNSFSPPPPNRVCFVSFLQVRTFHSVRYVRHCTASTVVPKYSPHLVQYHLTQKMGWQYKHCLAYFRLDSDIVLCQFQNRTTRVAPRGR